MLTLLLTAALALAFQPAPITVEDCLLASGYSRAVPDTPITELVGVPAWAGGVGERVLREGASVGMAFLEDSEGHTRMIGFYVYGGAVYLFVYRHPEDATRRYPGDPPGTIHGDCMLRLTGGG